jgi:small-conductance mechanosensitive channel/CRP-like cAMP-binding protein
MVDLKDPLTLASVACMLFGLALYVRPMKLPFLRAALRIGAFAVLTAAMLHAGISPTRPIPAWTSVLRHGMGQILVGFWWIGGAAVVNSIVRASLRIRRRPARERLLQDIVATLAYILATLQISDKVFGLPVGALLATSGAVAIVVGLALQSALGDAFSGLVLNLTRPYRIGDWIVVDSTLEGQVIETNWRATHLMTVERNVAIVPNSMIAKTRFINASTAMAVRGVTVHLQLRPDVRPHVATTALARALKGHREILETPEAQIAIRSSTVDFVDYEVRFFITRQTNDVQASAQFLDMAFQHLDSFEVSRSPVGLASTEIDKPPFDERLIDETDLLSALSADVRAKLVSQSVRYRFASDQTLANDGEAPHGILLVSSGVLSISVRDQAGMHEIARLQPGDHWVTMQREHTRPVSCFITALTAGSAILIPGEIIAPLYPEQSRLVDSLSAEI